MVSWLICVARHCTCGCHVSPQSEKYTSVKYCSVFINHGRESDRNNPRIYIYTLFITNKPPYKFNIKGIFFIWHWYHIFIVYGNKNTTCILLFFCSFNNGSCIAFIIYTERDFCMMLLTYHFLTYWKLIIYSINFENQKNQKRTNFMILFFSSFSSPSLSFSLSLFHLLSLSFPHLSSTLSLFFSPYLSSTLFCSLSLFLSPSPYLPATLLRSLFISLYHSSNLFLSHSSILFLSLSLLSVLALLTDDYIEGIDTYFQFFFRYPVSMPHFYNKK